MRMNTLHTMFNFVNEADLEVETSIAASLPSNGFSFMGAMEAKASRSQSTAYELNLPNLLVPKTARVVMSAADARHQQDGLLFGPYLINESAKDPWLVRQRFQVEKADKISSYEDIVRDFDQHH